MKINKKVIKEIRSWAIIVFVAFALAFIINSKAYAKAEVHQSSMEDTLFENQQLIIDELCYLFSDPERGDIITFYKYEEKGSIADDFSRYIDKIGAKLKIDPEEPIHEMLVKRVIGIEGDVIDIKDGSVYVNGEKLDEPYVKGGFTESNGLITPITVEKNMLFVLGDNRAVSVDSRELGFIDLDQVEGKAIFRVYPFSKFGKIK